MDVIAKDYVTRDQLVCINYYYRLPCEVSICMF